VACGFESYSREEGGQKYLKFWVLLAVAFRGSGLHQIQRPCLLYKVSHPRIGKGGVTHAPLVLPKWNRESCKLLCMIVLHESRGT
jgi:hypothetical protein